MKRKSVLYFFIGFFLPFSLFAQLPRTLPYHGALTDTLGNPKPDGVYTFTFRIYNVISGGSPVWSEIKDLQVKRGLFQTYLGDTTPFGAGFSFDQQYWLGIKPGADPELLPRVSLHPVASSLYAVNSDTARIAKGVPDNAITTAKIAASAVTVTQLANGSVNAAKIADEPGINYIQSSTYGAVSTISTSCQVASLAVASPAAGHVMVTGSGSLYFAITTAGENLVRVKISTTANDAVESSGVQFIRLQSGVGTGNYMQPFSISKVFPVSAGIDTFYLNIWHQLQSGSVQWSQYSLIGQYFPTRY